MIFFGQIFFWNNTQHIKAKFDIIPPAPNKYIIEAASLGDKEFLFRSLATRLQNSGDIFAGFVALKKYNYPRLYNWMKVLDNLNSESNLIPSLAAYYYSQTQNIEDSRYMIKYLDEHASRDIDKKWWWLFQSVFIAKAKLNDLDLALKLAHKLAKNEADNAPFWTKQMPAFIYEEMGKGCLAFGVIKQLIAENENNKRQITPEEMNFMRHFISNRLKKLKDQNFDPRKCKN